MEQELVAMRIFNKKAWPRLDFLEKSKSYEMSGVS